MADFPLLAIRLSGRLTLRPQPIASTARPSSHPLAGYRPLRVLGKGAFGTVYLARGPDSETVAIKRVIVDPRFKNRETEIHSLLHHPNCVTLHNVIKSGTRQGDVYENLIMESIPHSLHDFNLEHRNSRVYPAIQTVRLLAFQLFSGLQYLHSLQIVHRDIKPSNLLVDPDRCVLKICDFGSAKRITDDSANLSYVASSPYRSPELALGSENYGAEVDIWSAGCVIAEVLMAGDPLFQSEDADEVTAITKVIGPPTDEDLRSFSRKKEWPECGTDRQALQALLPKHTPEILIDLFTKIFVYNPTSRPSALECMRHSFFDDLFRDQRYLPNGRPFPRLVRDPA
jgi:glycogen synthase kinase 3 beta